LSGNSAGFGGAIFHNSTTATITNSTFFGNSASDGEGGGIYNNATMTFTNSILANAEFGNNCGGPNRVIDGGYNISYDSTCHFANTLAANGETIGDGVDPMLDTNGLQNNGGPTKTIALQAGSPAIDAIPIAVCPSTDQRGAPRPDPDSPMETACDIGAFESGGIVPPTPTPTPTSSPSPTPTPTPSLTPTSTPTASTTPSPTPTPSETPSPTPTSTATPTPSPTSTATPTITSALTATPSETPTETATSTITPTATMTPVPSKRVTLEPSSLNFGSVVVPLTSAPRTVTLSNGTAKPLTISGWSIGVDFKIVGTTCPQSTGKKAAQLPADSSCDFQIVFEPRSVGSKSELFRVFDSAASSPQKVILLGTGTRR